MYWKEVPVQVKAEDETDSVSLPLADRFQQGADAISMFDGSAGSDDYLIGWEWGEFQDIEGNAREAAESLAQSFNDGFPKDFVARIRDQHRAGTRDPRPGAIDHWRES